MRRSLLNIIVLAVSIFFVGYFDIAFAAKGFIVEKGGSNKILVTDGISQYVIEHDYNCYNSDFYDRGDYLY